MATIIARKRPDGSLLGYQAKIRRRGYPAQSQVFDKKVDAEKWARSIESAMDNGRFIDRRTADEQLLRDLLVEYDETVVAHKIGARSERGHLVSIQKDKIVQFAVGKLTSSHVGEFRDRMLVSGLAPSTVTRRLQMCQLVINRAILERHLPPIDNPFRSKVVRRPAGSDRTRDRIFRKGEEDRLMEELRAARHGAYLVPLTILAIETCMRQGELCSLDWNDIDADGRKVTVRGLSGAGSKNGDVRIVPLSSNAITALRSLPGANHAEGQLFPVAQEKLKQGFASAVRRADLKDFRFHDLRHVATTRLAKIFGSAMSLQKVTGHKTLSMLSRYFNETEDDRVAAMIAHEKLQAMKAKEEGEQAEAAS